MLLYVSRLTLNSTNYKPKPAAVYNYQVIVLFFI